MEKAALQSCGSAARAANPPLPRLGGVLGMTAPTRWRSAGRPHFDRAHVYSAPETRALMDLTGRDAIAVSALRAPTPLATAASVPWDRGFDIVRCWDTSRLSAVRATCVISVQLFHVVDIVRRHHPVVIVGSGSRALCSYACVQILIRHHDAWSPLGRQT